MKRLHYYWTNSNSIESIKLYYHPEWAIDTSRVNLSLPLALPLIRTPRCGRQSSIIRMMCPFLCLVRRVRGSQSNIHCTELREISPTLLQCPSLPRPKLSNLLEVYCPKSLPNLCPPLETQMGIFPFLSHPQTMGNPWLSPMCPLWSGWGKWKPSDTFSSPVLITEPSWLPAQLLLTILCGKVTICRFQLVVTLGWVTLRSVCIFLRKFHTFGGCSGPFWEGLLVICCRWGTRDGSLMSL